MRAARSKRPATALIAAAFVVVASSACGSSAPAPASRPARTAPRPAAPPSAMPSAMPGAMPDRSGDAPSASAGIAGCVPALEQQWQRLRLARYVPADRSRAQVEQVLLSEARVLAVQQAVGISIATTTSRTQYEAMANGASREYRDHFFELYAQDAAGVIVEERHRAVRAGADSVAVSYEARVACDAGSAAAGFTGSVETDQLVYRDGDNVRIAVEASDAARLFLFTVAQDGSAQLLFPNAIDSLNTLMPGSRRRLPSPGASYELKARLDERFGPDQSELLLAIFYTGSGPAPFRARDAAPARVFSLEEINRVLLRIPRAERTRVATGYEIRRR